MARLFYKKFDDPRERDQATKHRLELADQLHQLGFDSSSVIYNVEEEYRCSHRYPDYIEVYIETEDETLISALTIVS